MEYGAGTGTVIEIFLLHKILIYTLLQVPSNQMNVNRFDPTSLSVVMGQCFFIPVMEQSVFAENGDEDDDFRIQDFTGLLSIEFGTYLCIWLF